MNSIASTDGQSEDFTTSNEFTLGHGSLINESKRPDYSSKSKRLFKELSL